MNNLRILCTGKIVAGPIDWRIAPLPVDGELQQLIDDANLPARDFWWDGYQAQRNGKPLCAMPTERHESGWWQAQFERGAVEPSRFDGSIEDDYEDIRRGY